MAVRHDNEIQLRQVDAFCPCVLGKDLRVVAAVEQDSLPAVFHQRSITPVLLHGRVFAESIIENGDLRFWGNTCDGNSGGGYSPTDEKQGYCGTKNCRGIGCHCVLLRADPVTMHGSWNGRTIRLV